MLGKKERLGIYPESPMIWHDRFSGTFRVVYEREAQPDPGSRNYAYRSLGLVAFAPAGRGTSFRATPNPMQPPQVYALKTLAVNGMALVSGGVVRQPLYVPNLNRSA